ncbi:MAG: PorT family protein [Rikenellaceae bacterium]|nr:PorT family protein [Rikenellaceae bacterium]
MNMKKWFVTLLLAAMVSSLSAQDFMGQTKQRSAVRWGLIAGLNAADFKLVDTRVDIENKMGWQVGMMASIPLGEIMSIDPQIIYVHQTMDLSHPDARRTGELTSHSIDVPLALEFKIVGPLRLFAGPVFTVLNDSKGSFGEQDLEYSGVRTTLSYTVGAEVRLFDRLRLDLRYNGQFKDKDNVNLPDDMGGVGKMRTRWASFNVGYYF